MVRAVAESLDLAFRSLARNPTRTGLTTLGLAIGVAAFIAMVSFGDGARASVVGQFEKLGVNVIAITPGGAGAGGRPPSPLRARDLRALERETTTVEFFVPMHTATQRLSYQDRKVTAAIRGTSPRYHHLKGWKLRAGGMFDARDVNSAARVCALGAGTAQALFGRDDPLGQVISVQSRLRCRVIGVFRAVGRATSGRDLDRFMLMPHTTYRAHLAGAETPFDAIDLRPQAGLSRAEVQRDLRDVLRRAHHLAASDDDDFRLRSPDDAIQVANDVSAILTGLLAGIAGVSLLVGGIGIMNIQLVSVTERTQEIGIRAAIGAQPGQILQQFLLEAVVLALVGTLVGTALGTTLALVVADAMNWPTRVPVGAILIAFVFGAGTGVLFGYLPAQRAARLDPIEALRRE